MFDDNLVQDVNRILLEKVDLEYAHLVSDYPSLRPELVQIATRPDLFHSLMLAFRAWVVKGAEGGVKGHFEVPATWWDHFKRDVVGWTYKTAKLEYVSSYVCPHTNMKWPDRAHLEFLRYGPFEERQVPHG